MLIRRLGVLTAVLIAGPTLMTAAGTAAAAPAQPAVPVLTVSGAVSAPASYTLSQLRALPAETVTLPGPGRARETGVSLDRLVTMASPVLPTAKNALLRVIVTASGRHGHQISFALGELDPGFGNHDAIIALSINDRLLARGPALVVPGDQAPVRDLPLVNRIRIGAASPPVTPPPAPGALVIQDGPHQVVLTAARLAALPAQTRTVTFMAGTGTQTHTETGPALAAVLRAAHIRAGLNTWVAAVGSDGYIATVTPAEAWPGGRPLLISLAEDGTPLAAPRLVTDGDIKGGRYVSGVYDLVTGQGAPAS
jgi:hypothetical protein